MLLVLKKDSLKKNNFADKIKIFMYWTLIKFSRSDKIKSIPMSKNFIENLKGVTKNKTHVHHSHITVETTAYAHSYCNLKVRKNKPKITVVAHNTFRFDFYFLLKGLRVRVWRTRDICIGGKNPTDINFANVGNQVMFLNTIKYFQ